VVAWRKSVRLDISDAFRCHEIGWQVCHIPGMLYIDQLTSIRKKGVQGVCLAGAYLNVPSPLRKTSSLHVVPLQPLGSPALDTNAVAADYLMRPRDMV
jgi:hypothetical protein